MKKMVMFLYVISLFLCACSSTSKEREFPIEVGDSCAEASELLDFDGLYRSNRVTCANYYCWTFIRFYEDCTYESSVSLYETPRFNFMSIGEDTRLGLYSTDGTILTMKEENFEFYGEINGENLNFRQYAYSTEKVNDRPFTLILYEENK